MRRRRGSRRQASPVRRLGQPRGQMQRLLRCACPRPSLSARRGSPVRVGRRPRAPTKQQTQLSNSLAASCLSFQLFLRLHRRRLARLEERERAAKLCAERQTLLGAPPAVRCGPMVPSRPPNGASGCEEVVSLAAGGGSRDALSFLLNEAQTRSGSSAVVEAARHGASEMRSAL